jgi:hypothetical protein
MEVEAPSIRGTLTPNPAPMEADRVGRVYRVSHVVDGKFANLLRRNHSDPLPCCHLMLDARALTPIRAAVMMIEAFL